PPEARLARSQVIDQLIQDAAYEGFQLPVDHLVRERRSTIMEMLPVDTEKYDANVRRQADIGSYEGFEQHVRLLDGRLPAKEKTAEGVYEAVIPQKAIFDLKLALGATYTLTER